LGHDVIHPFRGLIVLVAALAGIAFTGTQIVERIATLRDPSTVLACDVNAVLSCSNVLDSWQSSVIFGIPNAFIGAVMFAVLGTAGGLALAGNELNRAALRTLAGLATFFAAFATWFMMQTAFVIGALCLWCIAITTAVGVIGAVLTITAGQRGDLGRTGTVLARSGVLLWIWVGWWIAVAALIAIGLT
jgi:uncharacterized membrane protein